MFVLGSNPNLALIVLRQLVEISPEFRLSDFVGSLEYGVFVIGGHPASMGPTCISTARPYQKLFHL